MFLNSFDRGTVVKFFCHVSNILRLLVLSDSEEVVRFSFGALWRSIASFASFSAVSLPEMPT